jgi:hypothetical protein
MDTKLSNSQMAQRTGTIKILINLNNLVNNVLIECVFLSNYALIYFYVYIPAEPDSMRGTLAAKHSRFTWLRAALLSSAFKTSAKFRK